MSFDWSRENSPKYPEKTPAALMEREADSFEPDAEPWATPFKQTRMPGGNLRQRVGNDGGRPVSSGAQRRDRRPAAVRQLMALPVIEN